ncbi:DUF3768 domain-containing protein [Kaistia terrae]|uniref:DUF3768 domain-containing protein n=1 Tax=Kaistia terrae TaxID=537017 RepID=A0ABW0Q3P9_9HYPH|nr:DUF3768 domain-containing protein [Kaistia terrae]MCX5581203.1 DUF3768 domain-containing protein [Kaistia terrae]
MNKYTFDGSQQPKVPPRLSRIRRLNDALRTNGVGGSVVVTDGIAALGYDAVQAIVAAVAAFDRFDADNDPYGERDFGSLEAAGEPVFFKIDDYDRSLRLHSPDPADAKLTARVLTIMLASEY